MTDIYKQHEVAFANVQAFVVTGDRPDERVATVAFKFPKDGAGRLYCYLHIIGLPMVRGYANGYGYDKRSAAVEDAMVKLVKLVSAKHTDGAESSVLKHYERFAKCLADVGGTYWNNKLKQNGYNVLQGV